MKSFLGKRVLITGGASGIGRIMARKFLERGSMVFIWDINQAAVHETISSLSNSGVIHGYKVDISDVEQVKQNGKIITDSFGGIDILVNNAGIVVGKNFVDHSEDEIARTMRINADAAMIITRQFLPGMIERHEGHICNIASSAGLVANPKMSVYVASKWAMTGWSDSLRLEMHQQKTGVNVTTVTPYYINTGMFDGIKSKIPILEPEKAVNKIIRGIERNKHFVSMPWSVGFVRLSQGLLPARLYDWVMGDVLGIYKTMDDFKGRV